MSKFKRKQFDFKIPQEVEETIDNLENAVLTDSTLLDCYLEEFRAFVHFNTDHALLHPLNAKWDA